MTLKLPLSYENCRRKTTNSIQKYYGYEDFEFKNAGSTSRKTKWKLLKMAELHLYEL